MLLTGLGLSSELIGAEHAIIKCDAVIETNGLGVMDPGCSPHPVVTKKAQRTMVCRSTFGHGKVGNDLSLRVVDHRSLAKSGLFWLPPVHSNPASSNPVIILKGHIIR